ncbi:MAG: hypothetical protein AB8B86_19855 [Pseudomonadales bacterium]
MSLNSAGAANFLPSSAHLIAKVESSDNGLNYWLANIKLTSYWLEQQSENEQGAEELLVVYQLQGLALQKVLVSDSRQMAESLVEQLSHADFDMLAFAIQHDVALFDPNRPIALGRAFVAKPWGQEIWHTGVEARGICTAQSQAADCPLPWLQAILAESYSGAPEQLALILLKILDPHPEPVIGDLYFELHEVKQEVYVITGVDPRAWPNGVGRIRIGFNREKRAHYGSDQEGESQFKAAYLKAVSDYRGVRLEVDEWLDANTTETAGVIELDEAKEQLSRVPKTLTRRERYLRQAMDDFTQLHELRVGDVVTIPKFLPHALQHGVRAVEFQTPVYERKIVSFAQKVLTQPNWDTEAALAVSSTDDYQPPVFETISRAGGSWQRVVCFDDFEVWRCELSAGQSLSLESAACYRLLMPIAVTLYCNGIEVAAETAMLLLSSISSIVVENRNNVSASYLLALPR